MTHLFKLENQVKHYDWGSPQWIPQLLGRENPAGEPWAELWMGVHPEAPSGVAGEAASLPDLIRQDPEFYLGTGVNREFGTLPFLYKLLAAARPLSVQAHPSLTQAREGWERENRAGISLKAANRNYKDPNHKPEILCALSPFRAMCGFREPREILRALEAFSREAAPALAAALDRLKEPLGAADAGGAVTGTAAGAASTTAALGDFLRALFGFSAEIRRELTAHTLRRAEALAETCPEYAEAWGTAAEFARLYPGDPAVIAPLYLNLLHLKSGEAIYLPAGVLHAYLEGFGVELMANSDNVLRGGLTSKHVDVTELLGVLNFSPFCPEILRGAGDDPWHQYPTDCREFSLGTLRGTGPSIPFPPPGPGIILVTRGRAELDYRNGEERLTLKPGESAFIAPRPQDGDLRCAGDFTLYAAGIPRLS
jgi:mannose-6-phosphate isomerase